MSDNESDQNFEVYDQSQLLPHLQDSSDSESDTENIPPAKKPRPDILYALDRSFASVGQFNEYWAAERTHWRMKGTLCEFGRKKGYACKYRLRIEFPHDSNIVDLYRSEAEHDHQAIASVNPLTAEVKDKIREYAKARLQPQRIRVLLSENGVSPLPSLAQVQNFVQRVKDTSGSPFTDLQLRKYCEKALPGDDAHEPFVLKWEFVNGGRFFVLWTTKNLLSLQKSQALIQADATNCVNWECYPLGVYGYSDCDRKFQPTLLSVATSEDTYHYSSVFSSLAEEGYEPLYVLGDGAGGLTAAVKAVFPNATRLMCYAHVDRRLKKRLGSVPAALRERIKTDIDALRYARSSQEFSALAELMMDTWPHQAHEFKDYFHDTYASGDLRRCLESTNRTIKDAHTLRRKLPFSQFIQECESALRTWSKGAKLPPMKPTPRPSLYVDAYRLGVGATKRLVAKLPGRDVFIFASSESKFQSMDQLKDAYRSFTAAPTSWMQFLGVRFQVHVVRKVMSDEVVLYSCTCKEGARKRLCKHALFIMCSPDIAMYTYPEEATEVPLEGRRKRGRPRKTLTQNRYAVN
ncbi:hypothetical protein AAVH_13256 [Aphelenchoides avenae]|nr:hypothetical protein AAVH_13256 [Aphelenchus avenae]